LRALAGDDLQELFFAIALEDVRRAADVLLPVHRRTRGNDGYVSFECTPDIADDADATIDQALSLDRRLDLPNVLIKVPATEAGVHAIEALTARGVNVNVTLLFSVERYDEVIEAYLRGLEHRVATGEPVDGITSVASFFVSRIDTKADARLSVDRVVTLPDFAGPRVPGLPSDARGFLPVDRHGRVVGVADVYAAGDATSAPITRGGVACQQADAAAETIAARAGAAIEPQPYHALL
jgi:hypothetical protein